MIFNVIENDSIQKTISLQDAALCVEIFNAKRLENVTTPTFSSKKCLKVALRSKPFKLLCPGPRSHLNRKRQLF